MIGLALGANVVADIDETALARAARLGDVKTVNSSGLSRNEVLAASQAAAPGGIQASMDALGREETSAVGILSLAPRGRHGQIGLFPNHPIIPMGAVIAKELAILGSHGMPARDYEGLLDLVKSGTLMPQALIERRLQLHQVPEALLSMSKDRSEMGVTIIHPC